MSDTPRDAFTLSHDTVDALCKLRPLAATFMGVPGHDDRWDDFSPEGAQAYRALLTRVRGEIARCPLTTPGRDDADTALALAVLDDWSTEQLDRLNAGDHLLDLNSLSSTFQQLRMAFDQMDLTSESGWSAVCARLEGLDRALTQYRALLAEGVRTGRVVAARQVHQVLSQCDLLTGPQSYFRALTTRVPASLTAHDRWASRVETAAGRACDAVRAFGAWLTESYLPHAPSRDAVGAERYAREAARFLGMTFDPLEAIAWGWSEVRAIAEEMDAIAREITPGQSASQVMAALRADPRVVAPSVDAFLDTMRARQQQALTQLAGTHFDVPDAIRAIEVRRAPPSGSLGAYYVPPSEDLSRPGTVWYSLDDGPVPLFDQVSTAYHEGFPGHHLQCALAVAMTARLSRLHRLSEGCTGYAEGWALYAERLMGELGFYERPEFRLGTLACQMIRALRVVIDIGSHLELRIPGDALFHAGASWTFERGVDVLVSYGGMNAAHANSEMNRYLGWPGQAIAYKMGEREILSIRDAWRAAHPGEALRGFHARVVGNGNVGLARLRTLVLA